MKIKQLITKEPVRYFIECHLLARGFDPLGSSEPLITSDLSVLHSADIACYIDEAIIEAIKNIPAIFRTGWSESQVNLVPLATEIVGDAGLFPSKEEYEEYMADLVRLAATEPEALAGSCKHGYYASSACPECKGSQATT